MQNTTGKIICAEYDKENNFYHYNFDPLAHSCLGSPISPENGQQDDSVININLRRCKTRITWNRSQNFRFYKCYDICFYNFCNKHLLKWKKTLLKSEIMILQIYHLFFWMLRAVKYLSELSFTFPFFSIYLKYLDTNKMMDNVGISIWNIWMWRKCEAKFRNPYWRSPHRS